MKYTLASEAALIERVLTFKDDPLSFARWAYPWGQPNTIFHDRTGLTPWQIDELGQITDHISQVKRARAAGLEPPKELYRGAWASGRGLYKTALFSILNHWHLSTHFGGMSIVAANSEAQLRNKVFPELALWVSAAINAHWFVVEGLRITPAPWLAELLVRPTEEGGMSLDPRFWYAGASMWSEERPAAFAGGRSAYGTLVLFDEASGIPEPVWTVTEGFFASSMPYKLWLVASQMRENQGAFYDRFHDPKLSVGWNTRVMSIESVPEKAEFVQDMARYGLDSDQYRVEVQGLAPRTSEDQFIPADSIRLAQDNMLVADYGEGLVMGVDPAPRGRTVIWFRQGRNARDCVGPATRIVLHGADNFQIAEKIVELDNRYRPVYITIDFGMGTGVIDVLKRRHLNARVVEVKFGDTAPDKDSEFGSMGSYLWGKLRDWLPGGMVMKDDGSKKDSFSHQALNRGWKWSGREDGKKVLESKDDLKARGLPSPDDVDALATTFAVNPPRTDRVGGGKAIRVDGAEESPYGW
jgi:hypothetical protein